MIDLVPPGMRKALVPVGRLDYNTEGLILLTDDGEFAQRVAHPRYGSVKTYEVKVKGMPTEAQLEKLRAGVVIEGKRTAPARITSRAPFKPSGARRRGEPESENSWWIVELTEGRTRQIREMFFPSATRCRSCAASPSAPARPRPAGRVPARADREGGPAAPQVRRPSGRKKAGPQKGGGEEGSGEKIAGGSRPRPPGGPRPGNRAAETSGPSDPSGHQTGERQAGGKLRQAGRPAHRPLLSQAAAGPSMRGGDLPLIVAIDGPSGVGKSTAARSLARRLGVPFLDTGAMYRAIGLKVLESGADPHDRNMVVALSDAADVRLGRRADGSFEVLLDGEPVELRIRTPEVGEATSAISAYPEVRQRMVRLQREAASHFGAVLEGRDIGTRVFPDTPYKFFLDARSDIRFRRRYEELPAAGRPVTYDRRRRRDQPPRPARQHPPRLPPDPRRLLHLHRLLGSLHRRGSGADGAGDRGAGRLMATDKPESATVSVERIKKIASERETAYLLRSEVMRQRLLEARRRREGISLEEVREKLGI